MSYIANSDRYESMTYNRCGKSGLKLPVLSLGLWHNFGGVDIFETGRSMLRRAFDLGITHFDLANNYGPPPGSAEETWGRMMQLDFHPYRDELIISTKAGYYMWPGPYGEWGSKKYLISSLDQSLKRTKLDYVDIFYSHRPDPETPLEETMDALAHVVRQGKALYVGISNYSVEQTKRAILILREMNVRLLIHQPKYSMLERWVEGGLLNLLEQEGVGCIPFSPLAQGLLTDRYLNGIPADSRAAKPWGFLKAEEINEELVDRLRRLNKLAQERGQSLSQMALAWLLQRPQVTSVLIGASSVAQLENNVAAVKNLSFSTVELAHIAEILGK
ncbi:MAG: L-glyceraldehyde 3-phosphate reductase [Calditrichaeota bacterium]|nr:MAG: L-glyceraldehyde 3-phosphate reductase [Calditrichota bacterium]